MPSASLGGLAKDWDSESQRNLSRSGHRSVVLTGYPLNTRNSYISIITQMSYLNSEAVFRLFWPDKAEDLEDGTEWRDCRILSDKLVIFGAPFALVVLLLLIISAIRSFPIDLLVGSYEEYIILETYNLYDIRSDRQSWLTGESITVTIQYPTSRSSFPLLPLVPHNDSKGLKIFISNFHFAPFQTNKVILPL